LLASLAPDELAHRVADIELARLRSQGIEGIVLDVDNTLVPWGTCDIDEETESWVRRAKQDFAVCLLSNSVRGRRMRALARRLGVPGISVWGLGRKPFGGGLRRALRLMGTAPRQTAMIGDQLLADILGGNRVGMHTVWVRRISEREFVTTRAARPIERLCARRLRSAGLMPDAGQACRGAEPG
jgi:HAD superfamily phosphatase (TIGR01668 family)